MFRAMRPDCGEAGAQRTRFLLCRNAHGLHLHAPGNFAHDNSPSPTPSSVSWRCSGPRFSGSKIWSKADRSMVGPRFTTSMRTSPSSPVSATRTGASGSPYLIAFETRLRSSCFRRGRPKGLECRLPLPARAGGLHGLHVVLLAHLRTASPSPHSPVQY